MALSHCLLYYVYYCLQHNGGQLFVANSWDSFVSACQRIGVSAAPTWFAAVLYFGYLSIEVVLALVSPGLEVTGRTDSNGMALKYNCNAYIAWWITLAAIAGLHYFDIFHMSAFIQNYGSVMTVAIIFADCQCVAWMLYAYASGQTNRVTGNLVYDLFMGCILHPRLFNGRLDIKLFAEVRVSWFLLFILTLSCAVQKYETTGSIPPAMALLLFAHFLYANATSKGEHFVVPTWDITYENYGWMLCFWNFAGVPFLYTKCSVWLLKYGTEANMPPNSVIYAMAVIYCAAYYIWDTSQSQKNSFRLATWGSGLVDRRTFPYLPWAVLKDPKYLKTKFGTPLLIDGWWRYGRKIHYTMDIVMALIWAGCTGFNSPVPWIYPAFFTCMIIHRYGRDIEKCSRNYGEDWKEYIRIVPYAFIPGVL